MDFLNVLYASIYSTSCGFSNLMGFVRYVSKAHEDTHGQVDEDIISPEQCFSELASYILASHPRIENDDDALAILVADDLSKLGATARGLDFEASVPSEASLGSDIGAHIDHLNELGLQAHTPFFSIVDKFPKPFDKFSWSAFCPDSEDEKRYGIKKGIYFRRNSLKPFYSRALLAHELVHTIPGYRHPEILAMGLEEGLAELIGSIYLAQKVLPARVVKNIFIYGRHGSNISTVWKLYLDHARQAALLYQKFGINGLLQLLEKGRREIHDVELAILSGRASEIDLPKGECPEELTSLVDQLLLGYLPNYVLSPVEAYLMRFVREGNTVKDIADESSVGVETVETALNAVSQRTVLFVMDDNKVAYSNVMQYASLPKVENLPVIRYRIGE